MSLAKKIKDMEKARAEARGGKGGVEANRKNAKKEGGSALPKGKKATMPKNARCPSCQAKVGGMYVDQFDKHVNNCI